MQTFQDIQRKIANKEIYFNDEEDVKQNIIEPILWDFDWDVWDSTVVKRESRNIKKTVTVSDYKLLTDAGVVIIEAKKMGKNINLDSIEEQLMIYSIREKAILSILTNGKIWRFFLIERNKQINNFEEGCFLEVDIEFIKSEYLEQIFDTFLNPYSIEQGEARKVALMILEWIDVIYEMGMSFGNQKYSIILDMYFQYLLIKDKYLFTHTDEKRKAEAKRFVEGYINNEWFNLINKTKNQKDK